MNGTLDMKAGRTLVCSLPAIAALALSVWGGMTLAQGLAVPAVAHTAQARLEQVFDAGLANGGNAVGGHHSPLTGWLSRLAGMGADAAPVPVARLTVPRLGVRETILSGEASHAALAMAPVMVKRGDAVSPVTVLAAHRDTHFAFVRDLQVGDLVTLQGEKGAAVRYRVVSFETVRWDRFAYPLDPARPLLALATCYPFGGTEYGGPLRRIAWAEKVG